MDNWEKVLADDILPERILSGEVYVEGLEKLWNIGVFLKEYDAWGQFLNFYRNLGHDCLHTRQSAKLIFLDEEFREKAEELIGALEECLNATEQKIQ